MSSTAITRQRADLTFKHNASQARHGWLRLTPAYSVKLVEEILAQKEGALQVLDPFSGTATTTLSSVSCGHSACSCDINPFLIWFGNAKLDHYSTSVRGDTLELAGEIEQNIGDATPVIPPPINFIERWWNPENLDYLCRIMAGVRSLSRKESKTQCLLLIAFCRTLIELSNASFGHQSVSFKRKNNVKQRLFWDATQVEGAFLENVKSVLSSAADNPVGCGQVIFCDARQLSELQDEEYDLLITSPPYPNRMSYIRELRPYMFWLGYLEKAREAGEMDWQAIGGTWGIATSRLKNWEMPKDTFCPDALKESIDAIAKSEAKSGPLLSAYVAKYFEDMWQHFQAVSRVMKPGAELHYIIGNSKFYDYMVHAEEIYAEMLRQAGFVNVEVNTIRKRNSKKELYEFDVIARKK